MEAMASARYVLSHQWDGAEELVPPEQLFLTSSQLNARILEYAGLSEAERRSRQAAMRARACELFDMEHIKSQIRTVIEEVAQEKPTATAGKTTASAGVQS